MTDDKDNPTIRTREVPNKELDYHQKAKLPDGTPVGKRGSKWYILDDNDRAVSKGYHEIRCCGRPNVYEGTLGAHKEQFTVGD